MRNLVPSLILFFLFSVPPCATAQGSFYVFDGHSLEIGYGIPPAHYTQWQVWLFPAGRRVSGYAAGLQYSRWGLIEGASAAGVMQRLKALQSFELAYLNFFGQDAWGRYTFSNPLGPILVTGRANEIQYDVLEKRYQLAELAERLNRLIAAVQPSLENNDREGPNSPVREYFDQVRYALEQVIKSYAQLARAEPPLHFIQREIAQTKPAIAQAEKQVPQLTAALPSVRLPTDKSWMSQKDNAGSDGTIETRVSETGSGVFVQRSWAGGDGSMTGTVIITALPYNDISTVELIAPWSGSDPVWRVRVYAAREPFAQQIDSPVRKTARAGFPAVHHTTTESSVYFAFPNSAQAHDAYAYFLYHRQLGR